MRGGESRRAPRPRFGTTRPSSPATWAAADTSMLTVEKLNVHYGRVQVLYDIDIVVGEGELVALIGANGAGKSTLINTISGINRASTGTIHFDETALHRMSP